MHCCYFGRITVFFLSYVHTIDITGKKTLKVKLLSKYIDNKHETYIKIFQIDCTFDILTVKNYDNHALLLFWKNNVVFSVIYTYY